MINLPIKAEEITGFKELQLKTRVKQQLAECVLRTDSLDRYSVAEQILLEAESLHTEAWNLVFKYLDMEEKVGLKYDPYSSLIFQT